MSICKCAECDKIYDTDYEMETNDKGDCICDNCSERRVTDDICANRHGGVKTSIEANQKVHKNRDRQVIYELVSKSENGLTLKEACAVMNKTPNQISGRFTEGAKFGWLIRQGDKRNGCYVWRVQERR